MISWVDLNDDDLQAARAFLDRFRDKGTIDHLGVGLIRDRISEHFFPSLSTIMTRACYYYLVPAALIEFQKKHRRTVPLRAVDSLAEIEKDQGVELLKTISEKEVEGLGLIGGLTLVQSKNKKFVERLPSEIYWAGLQSLGIIQVAKRRSTILKMLVADAQRKESGDSNGQLEIQSAIINADVAELLKFGRDSGLYLSVAEAEDLVDRLLALGGPNQNNVLKILLRLQKEGLRISPDSSLFDFGRARAFKQFHTILDEAETLAELTRGANLAYNLLLSRSPLFKGKENSSNFKKDCKQAAEDFELWFHARSKLHIKKFPAARTVSARQGDKANRSQRIFDFIENFAEEAARAKSANALLTKISQRIAEQEKLAKGSGAARLHNVSSQHDWPGLLGTDRVDYRWSIARRILIDIQEAKLT